MTIRNRIELTCAFWLAFGAPLLAAASCTEGGEDPSDAAHEACSVGGLGCSCTAGGGCDGDLVCADGSCRALDAGSATDLDAGPGGDDDGDGGSGGGTDAGDTDAGEPEPSYFVDVAVGYAHSCGLLNTGRALCWGRDDEGQTEPPPGAVFVAIGAGGHQACGLGAQGGVTCWGANYDYGTEPLVPEGIFQSMSVGYTHICGLTDDDAAICAGDNIHGEIQSIPPDPFADIDAGYRYTCAIRLDGSLLCRGDPGFPVPDPPDLEPGTVFRSVTTGSDSACAIREADGTLACFGHFADVLTPPQGEFAMLSISRTATQGCALREDGLVACFGEVAGAVVDDVPPGEFKKVAVDGEHACALRLDGTIACWGAANDPDAVVVPDPNET